jgi:hypothetical protein
MKEGGYYGSGRPENVAPGASMEVDFLDVPAEGTKPEPRAVPGTVPGATRRLTHPAVYTLRRPENCPKNGGRCRPQCAPCD